MLASSDDDDGVSRSRFNKEELETLVVVVDDVAVSTPKAFGATSICGNLEFVVGSTY